MLFIVANLQQKMIYMNFKEKSYKLIIKGLN